MGPDEDEVYAFHGLVMCYSLIPNRDIPLIEGALGVRRGSGASRLAVCNKVISRGVSPTPSTSSTCNQQPHVLDSPVSPVPAPNRPFLPRAALERLLHVDAPRAWQPATRRRRPESASHARMPARPRAPAMWPRMRPPRGRGSRVKRAGCARLAALGSRRVRGASSAGKLACEARTARRVRECALEMLRLLVRTLVACTAN